MEDGLTFFKRRDLNKSTAFLVFRAGGCQEHMVLAPKAK
jgi:hypothetical protein